MGDGAGAALLLQGLRRGRGQGFPQKNSRPESSPGLLLEGQPGSSRTGPQQRGGNGCPDFRSHKLSGRGGWGNREAGKKGEGWREPEARMERETLKDQRP